VYYDLLSTYSLRLEPRHQSSFASLTTDSTLLCPAEWGKYIWAVESVQTNIATLKLSRDVKNVSDVFGVDLCYLVGSAAVLLSTGYKQSANIYRKDHNQYH
jgi:hypothetical protein